MAAGILPSTDRARRSGRLRDRLPYFHRSSLGAGVLAGRRGAPLVDRSGGEAQRGNLVPLRQFGAAIARDPDQQGARRVLR